MLLTVLAVVPVLLLVGAGALTSYAVRLVTAVAVEVVLVRRAPRWRDRHSRRAAYLLAAALAGGLLSGVAAAVQVGVTGRPLPPTAAAEWLYLTYAPLTVLALLALPRRRPTTAGILRSLADALAAGGALSFLALTLSATASDAGGELTAFGRFVTDAHAVLPAAVIATALSVLPQVTAGTRSFVGRLAVGMALLGAADLAYCLATWRGTYSPTSGIAVLYEVALLALCWAALSVGPSAAAEGTQPRGLAAAVAATLADAVPYVASLAAVVVAVALGARGHRFTPLEIVSGLVMLTSVIARQLAHTRLLGSTLAVLEVREREAQERLRCDEVTALPNRLALAERLADAGRGPGSRMALAMVDVRGFRTLNDNHGHAVGDELLRVLGGRLATTLPEGTFVARSGADEFAVLAPCDDGGEHLLEQLRPAVNDPVPLASGPWALSSCVGLTVVTTDELGGCGEALVEADLALQTAKEEGTAADGVHVLGPESRHRAWRRAQVREAVAHPDLDRFSLVFQPIITLREGTVVAVESLLRWTDPQLGVIGPAEFIPMAEAVGSATVLTDHVLRTAAAAAARWRAHPHTRGLRLGVNLSICDLADPHLPGRILSAFNGCGVPLHALTVEVTEEGLLEDFRVAAAHLAELQAHGVRIAVDDYGTGYASLRYLRWFRPDVIKIDREFVTCAAHDATSRLLVAKVNEIALGMGGDCVAEGIEDAATTEVMRALGVRFGQGYHFARPMPFGQLRHFLAEHPVEPVRDASTDRAAG